MDFVPGKKYPVFFEHYGGPGTRQQVTAGWAARTALRGGGASAPDYEVGLRYFENGVADDLKMEFGDFSVNGRMRELAVRSAIGGTRWGLIRPSVAPAAVLATALRMNCIASSAASRS